MLDVRLCPQCHAENLPDRHFCRQCGADLTLRCPRCGCVNLVDDPACRACGGPLTAANPTAPPTDAAYQPATPARYVLPPELDDGAEGTSESAPALDPASVLTNCQRWVTVVKADLSGYTAMSEKLGDPEELTAILNRIFEPFVADIQRFGGLVDQYAGDMVIAIFGAPAALEDTAERGVRSALAMRSDLAQLAAQNISHGIPLGLSTGVASGLGLWGEVGVGSSKRRTISGELGRTAETLEHWAVAGQIGVDRVTAAAVDGAIVCTQRPTLPEVDARRRERLTPWFTAEPPREAPTWQSAAEQAAGDTPLCGQRELLEMLTELWRKAKSGRAAYVHLRGERGIGKTRLLLELARRVHADGGRVSALTGYTLSAQLGDDLTAQLDAPGSAEPRLIVCDALDRAPDWPQRQLGALPDDTPALIVTASRDDRPLNALRAFGRDALALSVPPLPVEDTRALAESTLRRIIDPSVADRLQQWSDGNPAFVRALCARLAVGESLPPVDAEPSLDWLPPYAVEWASVALDRLPESVRAAASAAAMATDAATLTFVPELVGFELSGDDWSGDLEELEAAGIVESVGDQLRWKRRLVWRLAQARLVDSVRRNLAARVQLARERLGKK